MEKKEYLQVFLLLREYSQHVSVVARVAIEEVRKADHRTLDERPYEEQRQVDSVLQGVGYGEARQRWQNN